MPNETEKKPVVEVVNFREKARAAYTANTPKPDVQPTEPEKKVEAPSVAEPEKKVELEKKPEIKPPSDTIAKSFEKLAVDRETLRKEREEFQAVVKKYEALEAAMKNKDPRALLALGGMTHEDYVRAWTGKGAEAEADAPEEPKKQAVDPTVAEMRTRLDQLEIQLQAERVSKAEREVEAAFAPHLEALKGEFPLSAKFGPETVKEALGIMKAHLQRTGAHLSEDPLEGFRTALAVIEERHKATVSRYRLLTTPQQSAKVSPDSETTDSSRVESVALTSGDEAARKPQSPTSEKAYKARALDAYRKHSLAR